MSAINMEITLIKQYFQKILILQKKKYYLFNQTMNKLNTYLFNLQYQCAGKFK